MFMIDKAAAPAVHRLCVRIAFRCAWVIQAALRGDDKRTATAEYYRICRQESDQPEPLGEM